MIIPVAVIIKLRWRSLMLAVPFTLLGLIFIPTAAMLIYCYQKLGWIIFMYAPDADDYDFNEQRDDKPKWNLKMSLKDYVKALKKLRSTTSTS